MEAIILAVLFIALLGFIVYLITENIPMPALFKQLIIVGCVVLVVLWLAAMMSGHVPLPQFPYR